MNRQLFALAMAALATCAFAQTLGESASRGGPRTRTPVTEAEWAKDAPCNCGEGGSILPVDAYATTRGACGGVDFWGNCWELTSTERGTGRVAVKSGAFDSKRTQCRTEARTESRPANAGHPNVTLRVVREDRQ
ncbi:MAG: hypothetical protein ACI4RD_06685 [Kiritimatiellia bacterium]